MLIERLVEYDRKRVALFVPKGAREPVWETELKRYLPHLFGDFSNLVVFNHTDLLRSREFPERLKRVREMADVIVIDEAHHFRNTGVRGEEGERQSRYWQLYDIAEGKTMFLLTATPVNNRLTDLQHMMELFSRRQADYFRDAPLGIHSLPGHFRKMEKELERLILQQNGSPNGMETKAAVRIKEIKQLRPLVTNQPWGIFFVEFEKKKLPVVILRRILSHLVVKKRALPIRLSAPPGRPAICFSFPLSATRPLTSVRSPSPTFSRNQATFPPCASSAGTVLTPSSNWNMSLSR